MNHDKALYRSTFTLLYFTITRRLCYRFSHLPRVKSGGFNWTQWMVYSTDQWANYRICGLQGHWVSASLVQSVTYREWSRAVWTAHSECRRAQVLRTQLGSQRLVAVGHDTLTRTLSVTVCQLPPHWNTQKHRDRDRCWSIMAVYYLNWIELNGILRCIHITHLTSSLIWRSELNWTWFAY